jgi:hypothetical protein
MRPDGQAAKIMVEPAVAIAAVHASRRRGPFDPDIPALVRLDGTCLAFPVTGQDGPAARHDRIPDRAYLLKPDRQPGKMVLGTDPGNVIPICTPFTRIRVKEICPMLPTATETKG